jgi:hypothetical protein
MKTLMIVGVLVMIGIMAGIGRHALAGPTTVPSIEVTSASITPPDGMSVGDRYLVPDLLASTVEQLPAAEQASDRYLTERIALADLVIGERTLAAEDLANVYAQELPGFAEVLVADGFDQDADGTWLYDPFNSWMRFPLNH